MKSISRLLASMNANSLMRLTAMQFSMKSSSSFNNKQSKPGLFSGDKFNVEKPIIGMMQHRKKPRQALFSDLKTFEANLPQIQTCSPLSSKELMQNIENSMFRKLNKSENILTKYKPNLGDTIEVEYFLSVSSGKTNRFQGVCVGVEYENTANFSFYFYTKVDGNFITIKFSYYSAIMKDISFIKKTSKKVEKNQKHMIGYKKLRYYGQRSKLLIQGGKYTRINKNDLFNLKDTMITSEQQTGEKTTIYDI